MLYNRKYLDLEKLNYMKRLFAFETLSFLTEVIVILALDKNSYDRAWLMGVLVLWFISDIAIGYYRGNKQAQAKRRTKKINQFIRNNGSAQTQEYLATYKDNLYKRDLQNNMLFDRMILKNIPFKQACIRKIIRGVIMGALLVLLWRII